MAKRGGAKPFNVPKGMFGYTADAMAAQIAGLGAKPTGAVKRVATDQAYATEKFGTSLSASIKKQFVGARAAAQQQAVVKDVKKEELAKANKTIGDVLTIFKGGAQAQAMAAAAAKARAVQAATGASDSQTAAFAMELAKMKYAATLQAQAANKAAAQAQAQTEQQYGAQMGPQMEALQSQAPMVSNAAAAIVNQALTEVDGDYSKLSVTDLQAQLVQQYGFDPASGQGQLGTSIIQNMVINKQGLAKSFEPAMNTVFAGLPGYDQWGAPTAAAITSSVQSQLLDRYVENPVHDAPPPVVQERLGGYFPQTESYRAPAGTMTAMLGG